MGIHLDPDTVKRLQAEGRLPPDPPKAKVRIEPMNGLEKKFAWHYLEPRKLEGISVHWDFNKFRLRLTDTGAKSRWYKPDFREILPDGLTIIYETKGFMRSRDSARIAFAADQHPIRLYIVRAEARWNTQFTFELVPGLWDRLHLPEPPR